MRKLFFALVAVFFITNSFAQTEIPYAPQSVSEPQTGAIYKLFPTKNMWTFLKLDTRNGRIWQIQFSVKDNAGNCEIPLSYSYLADIHNEKNGRFTLYPTENIYNFILLDQVDGRTWQVQWSEESRNRGIWQIK